MKGDMAKRRTTEASGGERAKSAARALAIIEVLAEAERGYTFTELEQALALPKSSLHELLSVLVDRRFVELDPDKRVYRLGIRVWESGQAYLRHRELVGEARVAMARIVSAVNETVQLAVLDEAEIIYLEKVDSSQAVRLASFVGKREPAHNTALGKALLAGLEDQDLASRLEGKVLPATTANTITSVPELIEEARIVRTAGFALDDEEFAEGLRCISVPIRGHRGGIVAALGVAVPRMRGDAQQLGLILSFLADGAIDVSRRLGCPPQVLVTAMSLKDRAAAEAGIREALSRRGATTAEPARSRVAGDLVGIEP
jgi:DNA-binding IclR family transcriptional regulator